MPFRAENALGPIQSVTIRHERQGRFCGQSRYDGWPVQPLVSAFGASDHAQEADVTQILLDCGDESVVRL